MRKIDSKYLYMSRTQRHIKSQSNIINGEYYAILQKPTNATFIPEETMETNEETACIRQESEVVYSESKLAENTKTEGQEETESSKETVQSKTVCFP